jgi:SAM-dependent methyltransferase
VLDLGCGYGRILNELIQAGYTNLHGVDPSNKMIERGLKENPSLDLKLQNKIEYPENSIDAIILNGVLTCIVEDHEQVTL